MSLFGPTRKKTFRLDIDEDGSKDKIQFSFDKTQKEGNKFLGTITVDTTTDRYAREGDEGGATKTFHVYTQYNPIDKSDSTPWQVRRFRVDKHSLAVSVSGKTTDHDKISFQNQLDRYLPDQKSRRTPADKINDENTEIARFNSEYVQDKGVLGALREGGSLKIFGTPEK